jgi:competence protein ComEA
MNARVLLAGAAAVFMTALLPASMAAQADRASSLPPGEGRDTLLRACSDCHGTEVLEGQRRSRRQWRDTVEDMLARGAEASEGDVTVLVDYLTRVLGRVNVNRASPEEIHAIVDLTAAEAAAIVEYRQRHGEFKTVDDGKKVPGLDATKLESRRDRIVFSGE